MKTFGLILVVISNFVAASVLAGPFQYECTLERVINDDGS